MRISLILCSIVKIVFFVGDEKDAMQSKELKRCIFSSEQDGADVSLVVNMGRNNS